MRRSEVSKFLVVIPAGSFFFRKKTGGSHSAILAFGSPTRACARKLE
jgi:hypothetical protein